MAKAPKVKDPNRLRLGDYFGTTGMSAVDAITMSLMTSWFMQYLTDYSGIGKWAGILGATLLMVGRLFDAVNDPLEGWIMDNAKIGKHGKYKPFILISILLSAIGVAGLFFLPSSISDNPVMICVWILAFYLLYDIGASFYAPNLVYRTMTLEQTSRSKLVIGPRMLNMIIGMITGGLIGIVAGVNANFNNMHTAFGVTILVMVVAATAVSLIGLIFVKEKYHAEKEKEEKVKITDILTMLKRNVAMRTVTISNAFSGFVWTFLFATALYYVKWAYCADLTTGAVDTAQYGILSLACSMMMFLPLILGTVLATPLIKLAKSAVKLYRGLKLVQGIVGILLFVLHIIGVLPTAPFLFFGLLAITATCIGIEFIPQEVINMEVMDYELYQSGTDRSALVNAVYKFINKAQSALASGMVGAILVAIGYQVDSATDTYLGELSAMPTLLTWFIVIMGLIPFFLALASWLILGKYPITDEIRSKMREKVTK